MNALAASLESRILDWIADPPAADFERMALEVHRFQLAGNPAYRRYCETLPPARDWRQIPALPQQVFKQEAVRSFPAETTARTFRTSGTTGEGFGEHHFHSLRLYQAAALRGWELAGLGGRRVLALVPSPVEAPHSSLSQMAAWLCEDDSAFFVRGGAGEWNRLEQTLESATEPLVLFGTALAFLDWMERGHSCRLPDGSLIVETGGYKGSGREIPKAELYDRIAEFLGIDPAAIVNEYGMTELSSQFYARGVGTPHLGPPWARALVIHPETGTEVADGETGILRLVDTANLWSVCAVQTRDLAIRRGDAFELIGRDPSALPRGCSRTADEMLRSRR